jgi:hypothetical protein
MPFRKGNMNVWNLGHVKLASRIRNHRATTEPLAATNSPSKDDWKIAPDVSAEQQAQV